MEEVDRFVTACAVNKISEVRRMLAKRPGICNMRNSYGVTGLHSAMANNSIEVLELLLAREEIDIAVTDCGNRTPLHRGCISNSVDCVRLYLAHTQCTEDIVTMQNSIGRTAEMLATEYGYQECARIVREYLHAWTSV